jgi:hypothetical protein
MTLVTAKEEASVLKSRILSGDGHRYDIALDDGTYLANTLVIDNRAVGLIIGGQTGYISISEIPQLQGRSVLYSLQLRRYHFWPLIGAWLRRRWVNHFGIIPKHPDWRPII